MREVTVMNANDVSMLLQGREREVIECVAHSYQLQWKGQTALPHSVFLRFPARSRDRIIALPAWVGGDHDVAGIKWISSFPENLAKGMPRASAVIVLNSMETGRARAILEGSVISACRTAASAALFAKLRLDADWAGSISLIGCGLINLTVLRYVRACFSRMRRVVLFDLDEDRARRLAESAREWGLQAELAPDAETALSRSMVTSLATTAATPYLADLSMCPEGATVLNLSLRDLAARAMLQCDNVVDDLDHVCREATSVELAAKVAGHTDFVRASIGQILSGEAPASTDGRACVYSPFGLGVLDITLAERVVWWAKEAGIGHTIPNFWGDPC